VNQLSSLCALLCVGVFSFPAGAEPQKLEELRSATWYDGFSMLKNADLDTFKKDLSRMAASGFNGVWIVVLWQDIEPAALPEPQVDEAVLERLDAFMNAADAQHFSMIFPLGYFGKGWSPEGVPEDRIGFWMLDDKVWSAYAAFVNRVVRRYAGRTNVLWLLYTESMQPTLAMGNDSALAKQSFRAYCREHDPDVAFWNARWKSDYGSIDEIGMDDGRFEDGAQRWTDHWQWQAEVMCVRFGGLAAQLKTCPGWRSRIGYHDNALITKDWAQGASPIPEDNPYDFLSFTAYRSTEGQAESMKENLAVYERYRARYPAMPLVMGEVGAATETCSEDDQARYLTEVAQLAAEKHLGMNIWMWQDFPHTDKEQRSFGLLRKDGSPKPALIALRKLFTVSEGPSVQER
jgi:hypothetical protein